MSTTHTLQPVAARAAAAVHAGLEACAAALRRGGHAAWDALETAGRFRARRELQALAQRVESSDPALAAQIRESLGACD